MGKKLEKSIDYEKKVINIKELESKADMSFQFASLPPAIQAKLGPFGLGHKLGDAAAGKTGQEAVDAIKKVFDGLSKGDWSVRAPAGPKVSKKDITDKLAAMDPAKAAKVREALKELKIDL